MQRSSLIVTGFFLASLTLSPAAWSQGAPNASSVIQDGRGNAAGILQTGTTNDAGIRQFGRNNTGVITQAGSGNTACLIQAGRNLGAGIEQVGDNQSTGLLQTRSGSREIPVELCATATTRRDVVAYMAGRSGNARGRGRSGR